MCADRLQNLIGRHGRAATGVLLLVAVLGVRSWVVMPHVASLKAAQQYERVTKERIEKNRIVNHELRAKQTRLEKLVADCASLSDMAFSLAKADQFLSDLEAFCKESGCTVASLSFMNADDQQRRDAGSSTVAKGAALTVHGSYGSITRLITKLQARQEKVWIDQLRMATLNPGSDRVACYLTITIYENLDVESAGHEHGPIPK